MSLSKSKSPVAILFLSVFLLTPQLVLAIQVDGGAAASSGSLTGSGGVGVPTGESSSNGAVTSPDASGCGAAGDYRTNCSNVVMCPQPNNSACDVINKAASGVDVCKDVPGIVVTDSNGKPISLCSNDTSGKQDLPGATPSTTGSVTKPASSPDPKSVTPSKTADTKTGTDTTKKDPSDSDATKSQAQSPSSSQSPTASSGDAAACASAHSSADSACGGSPPASYSSGATGINDSSAAYASAMQSAANANYNWVVQCTQAFNSCRNACQTVDPSAASACAAYSSKVQQVAQQTQQNINDYQAASAAQQASVTAPSSFTNQQINPNAPGCANDPTGALCQTCSADPSNQACQPQPQGNVGFKGDGLDDSMGSAGFAVPDPGTLMQQQAAYQQNPYAQQQQAMAGVPQGGGGGIGAGANGAGAKLGDARHGGGYAPPSNRADIMQGERGGGFGGYGAGPQNTDEFSNRGRYNTRNARRPAGARGDGGYLGMDLKRYLPGGMLDPGRQIGGMFRRSNSEIMGQTADLFRHISDRMQERCRLGLLYDCR